MAITKTQVLIAMNARAEQEIDMGLTTTTYDVVNPEFVRLVKIVRNDSSFPVLNTRADARAYLTQKKREIEFGIEGL